MLIHQDKAEASHTGHIGETFINTIHLLHQKDHYNLLELRNQSKTPESVTISQESLVTLFSQYFSRLANACAMMKWIFKVAYTY